ncbi:hypothetical protein KFE19_16595 [Dysosmobacter sp. Marseille-Q4140]|nr:hypothetical protein KFE19_16595 [Dysosmobacter sp. Marseille-Q4140]
MTREEAIKTIEFAKTYISKDGMIRQAIDIALSALRPVSREKVEKVWPGCEACKNAGLAIGEVQFYGPFEGSIDVSGNMQYCPNCGRPITLAAQEGQLERLEALKDGKGV